MCLDCWKVFSVKNAKLHRKQVPDHAERVLSAKFFASENKFTGLAIALDKWQFWGKQEYFVCPEGLNLNQDERLRNIEEEIKISEERVSSA